MESGSRNEGRNRFNLYIPLLVILTLLIGVYLGTYLVRYSVKDRSRIPISVLRYDKVMEVIRFIEQDYVDTISGDELREQAIIGMLESLDPHSQYISADELKEVNESLVGNFEGIGIEFRIVEDTINVVHVIPGGPSEKTGLRSGDRIVRINDTLVAGVGLTNRDVVMKLKGPRGTKVMVGIARTGVAQLIDFTITRDIIPLYSVDVAYLVNDSIGYIKLSKFSATTPQELDDALEELKEKGSNKLILDLRGNVGGYLESAIKLADEFLSAQKLIVYTEGNNRPRQYAYATRSGKFEDQEITILIDEGSASASEILAGAIQDNDRGQIIGRRSFGKGLVQQQLELADGSAVRLTVARYFTPTGRCIQKPYAEGGDTYHDDILQRLRNGELSNQDSIRFPDSLKYQTPAGKVVYGGGGIMPDIYIPIDTGVIYRYYNNLVNKGLIYQFAYDYTDRNRNELMQTYPSAGEFIGSFRVDTRLMSELIAYGEEKGLKKDARGLHETRTVIENALKAYIGRNLHNNEAFYPIINHDDNAFLKAVEVMSGTAQPL